MKQYSRGYWLSEVGILPPESVANWRQREMGQFILGVDDRMPVAVASDNPTDRHVVLLGIAVDTNSIYEDAMSLAQRVLAVWAEDGQELAIREAAYLSGRFVVIFVDSSAVMLMPDCHATLSVFMTTFDKPFVAGSHAALVAEFISADLDPISRALMESKDYADAGGRYYPGTRTPFENVTQVFANCFMRFESISGRRSHSRFYPFRELPKFASLEHAFQAFKAELDRTVRALGHLGPVRISLTEGLDSSTILAAAYGRIPSESTTYTYFRFEGPTDGMISDLLGANERAAIVGYPHKIIRLQPYDATQPWVKDYIKTFPKGARFPALAHAYLENFTPDDVSWISTIAETGTVFYTERNDPVPSPERLARKFSYTPIGRSEIVIRLMSEYCSFTEFNEANFFDFDYHDLFYWEHRNTKWASLWYAEVDLSHTAISPFNNRRLIEIMLSIPYGSRVDKYLLKRYASAVFPGFYSNAESGM